MNAPETRAPVLPSPSPSPSPSPHPVRRRSAVGGGGRAILTALWPFAAAVGCMAAAACAVLCAGLWWRSHLVYDNLELARAAPGGGVLSVRVVSWISGVRVRLECFDRLPAAMTPAPPPAAAQAVGRSAYRFDARHHPTAPTRVGLRDAYYRAHWPYALSYFGVECHAATRPSADGGGGGGAARGWQAGGRVPYWAALLVLSVAPLRRAYAAARSRARRRDGRCHGCGYDRRATPGRCPECGRGPTAAVPSRPALIAARAGWAGAAALAALGVVALRPPALAVAAPPTATASRAAAAEAGGDRVAGGVVAARDAAVAVSNRRPGMRPMTWAQPPLRPSAVPFPRPIAPAER